MPSALCGQPVPCALYLSRNPGYVNMTVLYAGTYTVSQGSVTVNLNTPITVDKGNLILINQKTARITIDRSSNFTYSDMYLQANLWTSLNTTSNFRLMFNPNTDLTVYSASLRFSQTYSLKGLYSLSLTSALNSVFQQNIFISESIRICFRLLN